MLLLARVSQVQITQLMVVALTISFFWFNRFLMKHNVSAMVSTGIKLTKLSIKHLSKTFCFILSFHFKAKSKRFGELYKYTRTFGLSTKTRINYSHCCVLAFEIAPVLS